MPGIYRLFLPLRRRPGVSADIPHSGRDYPADFRHACPRDRLRQAEDAYLDQVLSFLPAMGVPLLQAEFPRSYIDPNRPDDIGPLLAGDRAGDYNLAPRGLIRGECTPRDKTPVYDRAMTLQEAFRRASFYYYPYHRALREIVAMQSRAGGGNLHLDFHSMPSTLQGGTVENRYDIILGTRTGESASDAQAQNLASHLRGAGFKVGVNVSGFSGDEVVRRAGNPAEGRHAIQIEINRKLYLDEEKLTLTPAAEDLSARLQAVLAAYLEEVAPYPKPRRRFLFRP